MRINGTFRYRPLSECGKDPVTGFPMPTQAQDYKDGGCCQIDKSIPAKHIIGADGQVNVYNYDVFIPRCFDGGLAVGVEVQVVGEDGSVDKFTIQGVDNLNRKYIEIWG